MIDDPFRCLMPYPEVAVRHAPAGPLGGLGFAVKDLYDIKGYPTSAGSPHVLALSGTKTRTAPIVGRLLRAGAHLVAKSITDELAFSLIGNNAHFGAPINAAAPERITGGSSSGSAAAVAGGLAAFALGTDTGGSVRAPASYCGLFGIRPTHGRVSLAGIWPLAESLDTPGFFARDGETFARVAAVFLGADRAALPASPRLLLAEDLLALAVPDARTILHDAIRRVGLAMGDAAPVRAVDDIDALYWAFRHIQGREAWAAQGWLIARHGLCLGPGIAERFAFASQVSEADYDAGTVLRGTFRTALARLLGRDGVLVLPTVPDIAPLRVASDSALEDFRNRALRLLCLSGLSGFPQISVPGLRRDGAPLGLSLIGPAGSDLSLVQVAIRVEQAMRVRLA